MIEVQYNDQFAKLPIHVDDWPFRHWVRFRVSERYLQSAGADLDESSFVATIKDCLTDLLGGDFVSVVPFGSIDAHIKERPIIFTENEQVAGREVTALNIYMHLSWVNASMTPAKLPYTDYYGQQWSMTTLLPGTFAGELTAQETIEALQIRGVLTHGIAGYIGKMPLEEAAAIAQDEASLSLMEAAILLRVQTDGKLEPLPAGETAIVNFAKNRIEELEELPASVLLSVPFFLTISLASASRGKMIAERLKEIKSTRRSGLELKDQETRQQRRKNKRQLQKARPKAQQTPGK